MRVLLLLMRLLRLLRLLRVLLLRVYSLALAGLYQEQASERERMRRERKGWCSLAQNGPARDVACIAARSFVGMLLAQS